MNPNPGPLGALLFLSLSIVTPARAQLDEDCTVTARGQTVKANPDGTFLVTNVPADTAVVRTTATCVRDGVVLFGASEFFVVPDNDTVVVEDFAFSPFPLPSLVSLTTVAQPTTITDPASTAQILTTAFLSDGSSDPADGLEAGTTYTSSNPAILTVDADGVVTPVAGADGAVSITVVNRGVVSVVGVALSPGDRLTDVEGFAVFEDGSPVDGGTVTLDTGGVGSTGIDGHFSIPDTPTLLGPLTVEVTIDVGGEIYRGVRSGLVPIPEGITDAGIIETREPPMDVAWTGAAPDGSWFSPDNWANGFLPRDIDTALFGGADAGSTNFLDALYVVGGLRYSGNATHTTDFAGSGFLQIDGPLRVGYGGSSAGGHATWQNGGVVRLGEPDTPRSFEVGTQTSGSISGSLTVADTDLRMHASNVHIGRRSSSTNSDTATGTLVVGAGMLKAASVSVGHNQDTDYYAGNNGWGNAVGVLEAQPSGSPLTVEFDELNVGRSRSGAATGTLRWDRPEPLVAGAVYFGRGMGAKGILDVPAGGTLKLGTSAEPVTSLRLAYNDYSSANGTASTTGHVDLSVTDPFFEAHVSGDLSIGRKVTSVSSGTTTGRLILGSNSTLIVGTAATPANVQLGYNQDADYYNGNDGWGNATGLLDVTAPGSVLSLGLNELNVGRSRSGPSTGTLRWDRPEALAVSDAYFGRGQGATGILDVPVGGTFKLGSPAEPVNALRLGYNDATSYYATATTTGHLDFSVNDPVFEAHVATELSIGRKVVSQATGLSTGKLILGSNSTLVVGSPQAPTTLHLGYNQDADYYDGNDGWGNAVGVLDVSAPGSTLSLHLVGLSVGRSRSGAATGTLRWDRPEPLLIPSLTLGRGQGATGILDVPTGGTFKLGSPDEPVNALRLGYNDATSYYATATTTGHLDLSVNDPVFEAHVATELSIGRKVVSQATGLSTGKLILGSNSTLVVGSPQAPATLHLGYNQDADYYDGNDGWGNAVGVLDVSAPGSTLSLYLTGLNVGRSRSGAATGTLRWDRPEPLLVPSLTLGRGQGATGILDVPAGGTLKLGTSAEPVNVLRLGYNDATSYYATAATTGHVDLTTNDPIFEAHVGAELSVGRKVATQATGTSTGRLVLGSNSTLVVGTPAALGVAYVGYNQDNDFYNGNDGYGNAIGVVDASVAGATMTLELTELNVGLSLAGAASGTLRMGDGSTVTSALVRIGAGGSATGTFELAGGTLNVATLSLGSGSFDFVGGMLELGTFNKTLTQAGGTLAVRDTPSTASVSGGWMPSGTSTLRLTLDATGHDSLAVGGTATLAGTLEVVLADGYVPSAGDAFVVLTAGTLVGTFDTEDLPDGAWSVSYDKVAHTVTLEVQ